MWKNILLSILLFLYEVVSIDKMNIKWYHNDIKINAWGGLHMKEITLQNKKNGMAVLLLVLLSYAVAL